MDAGALDTRITIKRLVQTGDGFGGTTRAESTIGTVWAKKRETSGEIQTESGRRARALEIELTLRKKTADTINNNDILEIDGVTGAYRITEKFESGHKFFTTIKAVKIG